MQHLTQLNAQHADLEPFGPFTLARFRPGAGRHDIALLATCDVDHVLDDTRRNQVDALRALPRYYLRHTAPIADALTTTYLGDVLDSMRQWTPHARAEMRESIRELLSERGEKQLRPTDALHLPDLASDRATALWPLLQVSPFPVSAVEYAGSGYLDADDLKRVDVAKATDILRTHPWVVRLYDEVPRHGFPSFDYLLPQPVFEQLVTAETMRRQRHFSSAILIPDMSGLLLSLFQESDKAPAAAVLPDGTRVDFDVFGLRAAMTA